jgi:membrane-associated phospholipid phosphatase
MKLFDLSTLTRRELMTDLIGSAAFLLFQYTIVGLIPAQVVMVVLFNLLFLAHPISRRLAVAMLPFVVFEISYDWMRLYPNYKVNPIDIRSIYESELSLFGITSEGTTMIPGEYFTLNHTSLLDLLAGIFYLCWVPGPMALGLWLLYKGENKWYLRFALAFLFVNFVGFAGYYIHPAAPPWYALQFGFEPDFSTPGNVAGLARFDELIGVPVFHSIYVNNSNIFAAVPSLHAAYMLVATVYAVLSRRSWPLIAVCAFITMGIWWTAVYSCHHYIIDVVLGIFTAFIGIFIFERVLLRWPAFRRFFDRYCQYIS